MQALQVGGVGGGVGGVWIFRDEERVDDRVQREEREWGAGGDRRVASGGDAEEAGVQRVDGSMGQRLDASTLWRCDASTRCPRYLPTIGYLSENGEVGCFPCFVQVFLYSSALPCRYGGQKPYVQTSGHTS